MTFTLSKDIATGALSVKHETTLTEDGIRQLVDTGKASVGCFVRCADTVIDLNSWTLTQGSGKRDEAHDFITFPCRPETEALRSRMIGAAPVVDPALPGCAPRSWPR